MVKKTEQKKTEVKKSKTEKVEKVKKVEKAEVKKTESKKEPVNKVKTKKAVEKKSAVSKVKKENSTTEKTPRNLNNKSIYKLKLAQRAIKNNSVKVLNKINVYDVLITPILTEKAYKMSSDINKYVFKVHKDANKNDIKQALKTVFNVVPVNVNIVNVNYKWRSHRKLVRKAYKKAIISLKKWDKIEIHM